MERENLFPFPGDIKSQMETSVSNVYRKNEKLFLENQAIKSVYFLVAGNVRTYKKDIESGRRITLELISNGNFFGYHEVITKNKSRKTSSEVISKTAIIQSFTISEFYSELLHNRVFYMDIMCACKQHQNKLWDRIVEFQLCRSTRKIGLGIISLVDDQILEEGITTIENYTHQLLAEYTGSSRQTITSTLNYFRRMGLIEYDRKKIVVNVGLLKTNLMLLENG